MMELPFLGDDFLSALEVISKLEHPEAPAPKEVQKASLTMPEGPLTDALSHLENLCADDDSLGRVAYTGVFASGERQSSWAREDVRCDDLLSLIANGTAGKVLKCIGSQEKLSILMALLKKPCTVQQLLTECDFQTTGKAYHHLKPLLSADIVSEDTHHKGTYVIVPHRVQGLVMLLCGICDLTDPTFTQGSFAD